MVWHKTRQARRSKADAICKQRSERESKYEYYEVWCCYKNWMNRQQSTNETSLMQRGRSGTGRLPPTPAAPAPRTAPLFADETCPLVLVLGIEMQCLVLVRDQYLKPERKTSETQETPQAHDALVGRVGEQERGKEDEEDAKCRLVEEDPLLGFCRTGGGAPDGKALSCC